MKKLILLFVLLILFILNLKSENTFKFIGKHIYIEECMIAYTVGETTKYPLGLYSYEAVEKNKFKKEYLITQDLKGIRAYVEDVFYINKENKKKKALIVKIKKEDDKEKFYAIYFPCYYLGSKLIDGTQLLHIVDGNDILIDYYNLDEIDIFNKYMKNKYFYFINSDKNTKKRLLGISLRGKSWCFSYSENEMDIYDTKIGPDRVRDFVEYNANRVDCSNYSNNGSFNDILNSLAFEDDLIDECKNKYEKGYISSLKSKYLNQQMRVNGIDGLFVCDSISICNTDEGKNLHEDPFSAVSKSNYPHYDYVLFLSNLNKRARVPIQNLKYVELESDRLMKIKQQKEKEEKEEKIREEEDRQHRSYLVNKYGKKNAEIILNGEVRIGFTKEMCREAWGEPSDINRTITRNRITEQWVYDYKNYLYFEGNRLAAIQN